MRYDSLVDASKHINYTYAAENQMNEVATLICSDESIGGHYEIEQLTEQLQERLIQKGCRNLIIKDGNKIVAHIATYAESPLIGVLGGLVVAKEYRNMGYGTTITAVLANELINEGKTPLLYCYNSIARRLHLRCGATVACECGKAELTRR